MHVFSIRLYQAASAAVIVIGIGWCGRAAAQCTKDSDCKGDRVCNDGVCVSPTPPAPATPAVPTASYFAPTAPPTIPTLAPAVVPANPPAPIAPMPTRSPPSTLIVPMAAPAPDAIIVPTQPAATPTVADPTPAAQAPGSASLGLNPAQAPPGVAQNSGAQADTSDGRSLRIAGILCTSVGLASIAAGVVFFFSAKSYSDAVTNQDRFDPSYETTGKRAELLQWIFYGVGGAAVATGATMYWLGRPSAARDGHARLEVSPALWPGAGGISARGTF